MPFDLASVIRFHEQNDRAKQTSAHNARILKCIVGGLRMAERHRIDFDPRDDYWFRPERRLTVAYLASKWPGRFAPPSSVRAMALQLNVHMDRARADGVVRYQGVGYKDDPRVLGELCATLAEHARRANPISEWTRLRQTWPKLASSAGEDLATFIEGVPGEENWDRGFRLRLPWFAYLGCTSLEELLARQAFFFGYANLLTSSNAYRRAAAMSFASVIQNTTTKAILDPIQAWVAGSDPRKTPFMTLGKDDEPSAPQDRSEYSAVVEIYGFLNLPRAPFYNSLAEQYREWFDLGPDGGPYELMERVGSITDRWLATHDSAVPPLAQMFATMMVADLTTEVELESVSRPRYQHLASEGGEHLLDARLLEELDREARDAVGRYGQREAAAAALHLLLDARLYTESLETAATVGSVASPPIVRATTGSAEPVVAETPAAMDDRVLPQGLRPAGERALSYLRAGLHVLFAGAPGTGKTTLAQFVGHAWDRGLSVLPERAPISEMPLTTVGNSAWSPFHTIGGLVPDQRGEFVPHKGIFIDPASTNGATWRLLSGAIVLDEMNRADLDRCIGELYPLLSGSVDRVVPAGLPGVSCIESNARFRVLATVNDSTVDDIVFPISEGLARRFQRIELPGASRAEVLEFLGVTDGARPDERSAAVTEAVALFFEVAKERNLLVVAEDDDRLPFGVGYFMLIKAWMSGRLWSPLPDATIVEQARDLLAGSLRTLGRTKVWEQALRDFLARA